MWRFPRKQLHDMLGLDGRIVEKKGTKETPVVAMNIKSEKAHRMAQELAELTGETQTEAVTTAIQE